MKFDKHISISVNKAQWVLAMIRRSFYHMEKVMFLILFKSIICPLLTYCSLVLSLYLKRKMYVKSRIISAVQTDRNDMIPLYKALHEVDDIKWQNMFSLSTN